MIDRACISLSSKCQLGCFYCHFDSRIDKSLIEEISEKDALNVVRNLYGYACRHHCKIKIGLVGSGEPMLRFDLIKKIVEIVEDMDSEHLLSFYTISNGVFFNDQIGKFFFEHRDRIKLCFSVDGYEEIHDLCRTTVNKKGSFAKVMRSVETYRIFFGESPSVNATVHRETLRNAEKVLDFFEENFKDVTFSRLVDVESPALHIEKRDFQEFMELAKCRALSLRQTKAKKYDCTMYGQLCGVGRTNIYIDGGKVYPCGRFVGNTKFELGNATDPIEIIEQYMVSKITPCADGECYYDNL